ncbi:unnamed protein product [Litomosoides sigmodontis]|uniref:PDZ domain-containing protein n=1 Tax=Litomosoides sigmodontis TaxID=42156 RepID=A0A3P6V8N9_LITSI|nr:unnamed protein product [Litomosoides sigmodontis]
MERNCCLIPNPSLSEEHQEDSGIENNCRGSSVDDHSPATSVDFYPSIELSQLDTRHYSLTSSLSPSPQSHQQHCSQHPQLPSSSIRSFPEKSFTHPIRNYSSSSGSSSSGSTTATEHTYSIPSTSKLHRTRSVNTFNSSVYLFLNDDILETEKNKPSQSRSDNSQKYLLGEPSDSDSDLPAPPDYLLPATLAGKQSVTSGNNLYGRSEYINMKGNSSNTSLSVTKREPLSTLSGKRNTPMPATESVSIGIIESCREHSAASVTSVKFPAPRQTNSSSSHNCTKIMTNERSDDDAQVITNDNTNKSKQVASQFLPYTSTTLSSVQARGHHVATIDGTYPRTSPKFSRTTRMTNDVHEVAVPKSQLKTVDIQFEDKPGAAYQPSNLDRSNTKMGLQNTAGETINVKINLNNEDGTDARKHFGFTVTGGKDKSAPVKIDAVIVGTPADQAGLQVGDLVLSINGESLADRYYQCVVRMLHEAERVGDVELRIRRSDNSVIGPRISTENPTPAIDQRSAFSFDQKRALFDDKYASKGSASSRGTRKPKHSSPTHKWSSANLSKQPENAPSVTVAAVAHNVKDGVITRSNSALSSSVSNPDDDDPRMAYVSGKYAMRHSRERFSSRTSLASSASCSVTGGGGDPDYRVTSLHDKPKPGKLTDFIPEVERKTDIGCDQDDGASAYSSNFSRRESDLDGFTNLFTTEDDGEVPLVLRNYDVTPVRSITTSPIQHKISYWMKKDEARTMSLPRNIGGEYRRNGYVVPCNLQSTIKSTIQRNVAMTEGNGIDGSSNDQVKTADSRDWREMIEQQRLPSSGGPESRHRVDVESKLQVTSRHALQSEAARMKKSDSGTDNLSSVDQFRSLEGSQSVASNSSRANASDEPNSRKAAISKSSSNTDEPVLSVSGKHRCSHCNMELGRGAAMIIESLNLFYHLSCFRCYVCKMTLGNGTRGTDVRVRDSKLHCQNCYSSKESGLKFSKV